MNIIQNSIRWLEVAGGQRVLKIAVCFLALAGLTVLFNFRGFRNMATLEAMDSAQLARNMAEGKGYTTSFIRPFSMYLLKEHNQLSQGASPGRLGELTQIKERHPDISNPPIYPLFLAGLMKVLPFQYALPTKPKPFFSRGGSFWRYQPDFIIAVFNQALFFILLVLVFFLARRLFDPVIAWVSAGVLYGTDLLWRFSVSGLSTMLLLLLFVGLVWCLVWLEEEARESRRSVVIFVLVAMAAGVLVGLGGLTRYAYAWMILPVVIYLLLVAGQRRFLGAALVFVAFALVFAPWIVRNYRISGTPLGTAGYALYETSALFPEQTLQRSLEPDFSRGVMAPLTEKLLSNTRNILQNEFPKFAGGWVGIFFMAGLLVGFPHPSVSRLRYFLIACLGVFVVVQALGRTQLSEMIPEINSENLLVLFVPLVVIYGVSFFFLLLNQIVLPIRELRYVFIALFFLSTCFPLGFSLLPPKTIPIVYPPYYPPALQSVGTSLKPNELMMSDIPWASAWYGRVQAMWLTLSPRGFMEINDYQKPIQALYISPATMDSRFLSHWIQPGEDGWSNLILQTPSAAGNSQDPMVQWPKHITLAMRRPGEQPVPFPLHYFHPGWPQQLILTSRSQPIGGP